MSETNNENEAMNGEAGDQAIIRVIHQYVKDLSFENPHAPQSNRPDLPNPAVEVAVDVNARAVGQDQYEVELSCSATATRDGEQVFLVECNYAGLFLIQNIPSEHLEGMLLVESPRILFPFARRVIADSVRDGGFTPLMLEPLDFLGMYRAQKEAQAQAAAQAPTQA